MAFDFSTLVTDRTQADVATGNAKGTYNAADLNRVDECLEDLVARLGRMGYNVPGYERVKIPRETKPTRKKYRYLRMTISALRGSTEIVQLSEIKILSKTGSVMPWPQGTTVTASIEETKAEESPSKLIDGNVETKFCSVKFVSGAQINIDLGSDILDRTVYTAWQWFTANDSPECDPVSFELLGSTDGTKFTVLDSASSATITEARNTLAYSGSIGSLPEGYTEVRYIQSTGTQYIDSGLALNKSDSYTYSILAQFSNDAYGGANGYMQFMSGIASGSKATIKVVYDGETHVECIYVDDTQKSQEDWTSTYSGVNVKIGILKMGDQNNGWFSGAPQIGKIFALTILNGGNLIRDFVPCVDLTGNVGLYDLVGGKFYGNSGTGSFTAGPVVTWDEPEEPTETLDPYTWYESDVPSASQMAQYRDNVAAVRAVLRLPEGTPGVPETMRRLTVAEANNIEAVLLAVDLILKYIPSAVRHCGVTVCGSKGVIA